MSIIHYTFISCFVDTSEASYEFVGNAPKTWVRPEGLSAYSCALDSVEKQSQLYEKEKRRKLQSKARNKSAYLEHIQNVRSQVGKRFDDEARRRAALFELNGDDDELTVESMPTITSFIMNKRHLRDKFADLVKRDIERKELAQVEAARRSSLVTSGSDGSPSVSSTVRPNRLTRRMTRKSTTRSNAKIDNFHAVLPPVAV